MNARKELLEDLEHRRPICAVIITWDVINHKPVENRRVLPKNYTEEQWQSFLKDIDFEYDSGYGSQHLFGTVWIDEETWLERGEYDGSEWWEEKSYPQIPEYLQN